MELFYIMTENDHGMKNDLDSLLHVADEGEKQKRLIEIMKAKIFKPEDSATLVLSNSWGYGVDSRAFIGGAGANSRRAGRLPAHAVPALRGAAPGLTGPGHVLRAVDGLREGQRLQVA